MPERIINIRGSGYKGRKGRGKEGAERIENNVGVSKKIKFKKITEKNIFQKGWHQNSVEI